MAPVELDELSSVLVDSPEAEAVEEDEEGGILLKEMAVLSPVSDPPDEEVVSTEVVPPELP